MPWLKQNDLVHSEQDVDTDRGAKLLDWLSSRDDDDDDPASAAGVESTGSNKRGSEKLDRSACEDESDCWPLGPRGMMVLFLKHVHLQKTGADPAETNANRLAKSSQRIYIRAIVIRCCADGFVEEEL